MENRDYIDIMIQSLKKKEHMLDLIISKNKAQELLLKNPNLDPDDLDVNMQEKAKLIDKLNQLDEGFQQVYDRIKEFLDRDRKLYVAQIQEMQELITVITEKGNSVRIQEQRNKQLATEHFSTVRKQIRQVKTNYKAVNQYYKNMMNLNNVPPQYVDHKK